MSDGPYRSLPMSNTWKHVARCGENHVFEAEQISAALVPALASDWQEDVQPWFLDRLISIFGDQDTSLFKEEFAPQLDSLRQAAGQGLGRAVLDCAAHALDNGQSGFDALRTATTNALTGRACCGARQVEEHYLRSVSGKSARDVRNRIEDGIRNAPISGLAEKILRGDGSPTKVKAVKLSGLDDGVRL
jgi:hypothetical protein